MKRKTNYAPILTHHAQQYVHSVFSERLQQEGFVSIEGNECQWVRIVNNEIVNSICFYTQYTYLPILLSIGYGIYPLFVEPYIPKSVYIFNLTEYSERFTCQQLVEKGDEPLQMQAYSPSVQVCCPGRDGRGVFTFNEIILPLMNQAQTLESCYAYHKSCYLRNPAEANRFSDLSRVFIDEAIYLEDYEMYPYCQDAVCRLLEIYQIQLACRPSHKETLRVIEQLEQQRRGLFDGDRDSFMKLIEMRKENNKKYFSKQLGIRI